MRCRDYFRHWTRSASGRTCHNCFTSLERSETNKQQVVNMSRIIVFLSHSKKLTRRTQLETRQTRHLKNQSCITVIYRYETATINFTTLNCFHTANKMLASKKKTPKVFTTCTSFLFSSLTDPVVGSVACARLLGTWNVRRSAISVTQLVKTDDRVNTPRKKNS